MADDDLEVALDGPAEQRLDGEPVGLVDHRQSLLRVSSFLRTQSDRDGDQDRGDALGHRRAGGVEQVDGLRPRASRSCGRPASRAPPRRATAIATSRLDRLGIGGRPARRARRRRAAPPRSGPRAPTSTASTGSSAGSSTSTVFSRSATNWSSSLALTSASTPRPNWATRPVTVRSVTMATAVPSPSGVRVAVMVALALPWPRVSRPSARSTATCAVGVERQELGLALVLRGDRADLHLHDAAVLVALDLLELRAGQARGDPLDVGEHGPGPLDGQRHAEVVGQLHRSRSSTVSMSSLRPSHGTACTSSGLRRISGPRPLVAGLGQVRPHRTGPAAPGCPAGRRRWPPRSAARRARAATARHAAGGDARLVGQPDHDGVVARRPRRGAPPPAATWRSPPPSAGCRAPAPAGPTADRSTAPATTTTSSRPASSAAATARATSVRPSTTASCFGPSPPDARNRSPAPAASTTPKHRHARRRYRARVDRDARGAGRAADVDASAGTRPALGPVGLRRRARRARGPRCSSTMSSSGTIGYERRAGRPAVGVGGQRVREQATAGSAPRSGAAGPGSSGRRR